LYLASVHLAEISSYPSFIPAFKETLVTFKLSATPQIDTYYKNCSCQSTHNDTLMSSLSSGTEINNYWYTCIIQANFTTSIQASIIFNYKNNIPAYKTPSVAMGLIGVLKISPNSSSVIGGTSVIVEGFGFLQCNISNVKCYCNFSLPNAIVPVHSIISNEKLICITPNVSIAGKRQKVLLNIDFGWETTTSLSFYFISDKNKTSIWKKLPKWAWFLIGVGIFLLLCAIVVICLCKREKDYQCIQ